MNTLPSLWFRIVLLAVVMVSAKPMTFALEKAPADSPNIIFFIADDMTPNMFNCLPEGRGKNLTPTIDRFAAEGVVLMGQHVVSPVCTPSRYNCLTGRYGSRATNGYFKKVTRENDGQKVVAFNTHLKPENETFPHLLQQAGYKTGLTGKDHVVELSGMKHFPDYNASARDPEIVAILKANQERDCAAVRAMGFDYAAHIYPDNPSSIGLREMASHNMDWITQGGINFINQYQKDPFFLYIAATIPHGPMDAKHSWNADPLVTGAGFLDGPLTVQPPRHTIPERLKAAGLPVNNRTGNMLWLDDGLAALMKQLEDNGLIDNTIIFFFNDHGQDAKGTLYQGGVHNPSIVWKKGGFAGESINEALLSNVDFAPTILDMAGVKYDPAQFDGESFLPYLNGEEQAGNRELYHELGYARAIRIENFKYIAIRYPDKLENMTLEDRSRVLYSWNAKRRRTHMPYVTEDPTQPYSHLSAIPGGTHAESAATSLYPDYYDRDQLYDLSRDPNEQVNLANHPEYAEKLAELKKALQKKIDDLEGNFDLSKVAVPMVFKLVEQAEARTVELMPDALDLANIKTKSAEIQVVENNGKKALELTFPSTASVKWPSINIVKNWDLTGCTGIEATLTNRGSEPSEILVRADNAGSYKNAPWNTTSSNGKVKPGETVTLKIEFGYDHYRAGRQLGYPLDVSKIIQVAFSMKVPSQTQTFRLDNLRGISTGGVQYAFPKSSSLSTTPVVADADLLNKVIGAGDLRAKSTKFEWISSAAGNHVKMVYSEAAEKKWPEVTIKKPLNLTGYTGIEAKLTNVGKTPGKIIFRTDNPGSYKDEPWNSSVTLQDVAPGESVTLRVDFGYNRYKNGRKEPGYPLDPATISQLSFGMKRPDQELVFQLDSLKAVK